MENCCQFFFEHFRFEINKTVFKSLKIFVFWIHLNVDANAQKIGLLKSTQKTKFYPSSLCWPVCESDAYAWHNDALLMYSKKRDSSARWTVTMCFLHRSAEGKKEQIRGRAFPLIFLSFTTRKARNGNFRFSVYSSFFCLLCFEFQTNHSKKHVQWILFERNEILIFRLSFFFFLSLHKKQKKSVRNRLRVSVCRCDFYRSLFSFSFLSRNAICGRAN